MISRHAGKDKTCARRDNMSSEPHDVDPPEAERLVRNGLVRCLDVRTPGEYASLGHIPGATLLPLDLIPTALGTIPREGKPLLVYCEHGIRSVFAARFLARAGYEGVLNLRQGMSTWNGPRDFSPASPFGPAGPCSWLAENVDLLPRQGKALDVACGGGRHTFLLAAIGLEVVAVDRDAARIEAIRSAAERARLRVDARAVDLETGSAGLGEAEYDLILVVHYLHRPLFPAIVRALKPGGLLLYETFTVEQARHGKPTNPAFLLEPGELPRLVAPLHVLRQREGEHEGRFVASVAARCGDL